jgi:adenine-specific DNA methylase
MTQTKAGAVVIASAEPQKHPSPVISRVLIEDWLPAAAIGVECMRERGSASALAPLTFLHVWWARRPLTISRAAVLGSLLPADFPHETFEKLLGFGQPGAELVNIRRLMDSGYKVPGGFNCDRAFKRGIRQDYIKEAQLGVERLWGKDISVIDPMAGGGSIPLEAARLGLTTLANEYNPVACSILEATVEYPFRFGEALGTRTRHWGREWVRRVESRLNSFFPAHKYALVHAYIFARTVPCPDTGHSTPLVPDWHLLKPKNHSGCTRNCMLAMPHVDKKHGTWSVEFVRGDKLRSGHAPKPTYDDGKGVSLFSDLQIPSEYIKTKAQAGQMGSALYAIALKTNEGLEFTVPSERELSALGLAARELKKKQGAWQKEDVIPTEKYPLVSSDERPLTYGMPLWSDMFSRRQLLAIATLVAELRSLRDEIVREEGPDIGAAVIHLLSLVVDKFANYNSVLASWHAPRQVIRSVFDRHDFSFKPTFSEFAPCGSGNGLAWAIDNVLSSYEALATLPRQETSEPAAISLGSATNLPEIATGSITAVVVDPPYADNVQYSELADFFYVWLKRTQGYRHPDWFSTYLCDDDQEAVVNVARARNDKEPVKDARVRAHELYQKLMRESFVEARRILRDDGVLTVMFTHKKQEAWEALFQSLIDAGFKIGATWPVKTESEHSLHQAKKNAAQSTVLLVARKRTSEHGIGYFDAEMKAEIRKRARESAERLKQEGLNPVDQLVGSFGPAMAVYSQYKEVRTDTGEPVSVTEAIDEASEAVSEWRIEQLAARGLNEVEPEGRFELLCWDVLGAAEFRFNEAHLLGKAVGMDVDQLVAAGLVTKSGDKVQILPVRERRRSRALEREEYEETLFGPIKKKKRGKKEDVLKVHPNDPAFRTALDSCHALALRYLEAGGGGAGVGSAKSLVRAQNWGPQSAVARLMEALVHAAPEAMRREKGKQSMATKFPEFRAWHALLKPLFNVEPPDWTEKEPPQAMLALTDASDQSQAELEEADEDESDDE